MSELDEFKEFLKKHSEIGERISKELKEHMKKEEDCDCSEWDKDAIKILEQLIKCIKNGKLECIILTARTKEDGFNPYSQMGGRDELYALMGDLQHKIYCHC